jgi:hypothetical protein
MSKYTKDDYFAVASALDLWGYLLFSGGCREFRKNNQVCKNDPDATVLDCCGAKHCLYLVALDTTEEIEGHTFPVDYRNRSFLAAQLACEKAGL